MPSSSTRIYDHSQIGNKVFYIAPVQKSEHLIALDREYFAEPVRAAVRSSDIGPVNHRHVSQKGACGGVEYTEGINATGVNVDTDDRG